MTTVERASYELHAFRWGEPHQFGSVAYWIAEARLRPLPQTWALTGTLTEEVICCMLGGHGMPAETGLAAFEAVRDAGLIEVRATAADVEDVLRRPLSVAGGNRTVRYRFPRQRASWVASALAHLDEHEPPTSARAMRDWLTDIPGVGLKTASWIVRNHLGSDDVAIIDVHIRNAGVGAGFFSERWRPDRDYGIMESAFLAVAELGEVSAAQLDSVIWATLHRHPRLVPLLLAAGRNTCCPLVEEVQRCPDATTHRPPEPQPVVAIQMPAQA